VNCNFVSPKTTTAPGGVIWSSYITVSFLEGMDTEAAKLQAGVQFDLELFSNSQDSLLRKNGWYGAVSLRLAELGYAGDWYAFPFMDVVVAGRKRGDLWHTGIFWKDSLGTAMAAATELRELGEIDLKWKAKGERRIRNEKRRPIPWPRKALRVSVGVISRPIPDTRGLALRSTASTSLRAVTSLRGSNRLLMPRPNPPLRSQWLRRELVEFARMYEGEGFNGCRVACDFVGPRQSVAPCGVVWGVYPMVHFVEQARSPGRQLFASILFDCEELSPDKERVLRENGWYEAVNQRLSGLGYVGSWRWRTAMDKAPRAGEIANRRFGVFWRMGLRTAQAAAAEIQLLENIELK
jgi:hypothetical protein